MPGFPRLRRATLALIAVAPLGCQSAFLSSASNAIGTRLPTMALSDEQERAIGAQGYQQLLQATPRTSHPEYQTVVEKVGRRLADAAARPDYDWEFTVLAGSTQNAFCLPGGKVAVYEGLLPVCENEAGLAVVLSHEIAHALARHGAERMKEEAIVDAVQEIVATSTQSADEEKRLVIQAAYGAGAKVGVLLPFSRSHETQADSIGLTLMAKAGYNPEEAVRFWRRFQAAGKATAPELLSTHPSDERRAAHIETLLPAAEKFYAGASEKLDRGMAIANLPPTAKARTVAAKPGNTPAMTAALVPQTPAPKIESAAPPTPPTASSVPPVVAPVEQANWTAAAPASGPSSNADPFLGAETGNPFLAPTPTTGETTSDAGWAPTVH